MRLHYGRCWRMKEQLERELKQYEWEWARYNKKMKTLIANQRRAIRAVEGMEDHEEASRKNKKKSLS